MASGLKGADDASGGVEGTAQPDAKSRLGGGLSALFSRARQKTERIRDAALDRRRSPAFQHACAARERGNLEAAFWLLSEEVEHGSDANEVALAFWEVAVELGRPIRAAEAAAGLVKRHAASGEAELATLCWVELVRAVPEQLVPPGTLAALLPVLRRRVTEANEEERSDAVQQLRTALRHAVDSRNEAPSPGVALRIFEEARQEHPESAQQAARLALESTSLHEAKRRRLLSYLESGQVDEDPVVAPEPQAPRRPRPARRAPDRPSRTPPASEAADSSPTPPAEQTEPAAQAPAPAAPTPAPQPSAQAPTPPSPPAEAPPAPQQPAGPPEELASPPAAAPAPTAEAPSSEPLGVADDLPEPAPRKPSPPAPAAATAPPAAPTPAATAPPQAAAAPAPTPPPVAPAPSQSPAPAPSTPEASAPAPDAAQSAPPGQPRPPLQVIEVAPVAITDSALDVETRAGRRSLAFADIQGISTVQVSGQGEAGRPVVFVDLILNLGQRGDKPLRVLRMRDDRMDLSSLGGELSSFLSELLARASAVPLPDPESAMGLRLATFDSLGAYEQELLTRA